MVLQVMESGSELSDAVRIFDGAPTLRALQSRIERLNVSADTKAILLDLAKVTIVVGGKLLAFGRKLVAFAFEIVSRFQNVAFGIVIALILSAVLVTIPLLGPIISAILTPLMLAFGIVAGAIRDFKEDKVRSEIDFLAQKMAIMSAHAAL